MTTLIIVLFVAGYLLITLEHQLKVNKAAVALLTGAICWTVYITSVPDKELINSQLAHHLGELSGIIFFLLGAMVIVELIDAHDGFDLITSRISVQKKMPLMWVLAIIAFLLSALLDNLTTTIVLGSLTRKLVASEKDRVYFMGVVVIAANAGGAWSPIGDVTTTMLWIGGQISSAGVIKALILPSLVSVLIPLLIISFRLKGVVQRPAPEAESAMPLSVLQKKIVFFTGLAVLLFVPVFKTVTHLPPYLGMLFGLGVLWVVTEIIHGKKDEEDKHKLSVVYALRKIDTPSVLFFFGILVSIACLQSVGILKDLSVWMSRQLPDQSLVALTLGALSAVVDNVPLVAAVQGMYSLSDFHVDHHFWHFLAYSTGTGGSLLIIGSAAGVAAMGIEKISFFWYLRHITLLALCGFLAGAACFVLQWGMA